MKNESSLNWLVRECPATPCGSDDIPEFGYVKKVIDDFDLNGKKVGSHEEIVFEQTGKHSQSEYINSFRSTTDIKEIFKRYQAGDVSVLEKRIGEYADTVGAPESLLDAKLMLMNGEKIWNEIPASMKEKYDNSVEKFITAAMNGELNADLASSQEEIKKAASVQSDEIAELRKQIEEIKGGVKYE